MEEPVAVEQVEHTIPASAVGPLLGWAQEEIRKGAGEGLIGVYDHAVRSARLPLPTASELCGDSRRILRYEQNLVVKRPPPA